LRNHGFFFIFVRKILKRFSPKHEAIIFDDDNSAVDIRLQFTL